MMNKISNWWNHLDFGFKRVIMLISTFVVLSGIFGTILGILVFILDCNRHSEEELKCSHQFNVYSPDFMPIYCNEEEMSFDEYGILFIKQDKCSWRLMEYKIEKNEMK